MPSTAQNAPAREVAPENLADKLTDFLARVSREGVLSYVSRRGAQWLDRPEMHVGKSGSLSDLFLVDDHPALMAALNGVEPMGNREFVARMLKRGGDPVWVNCRVFPLAQRGEHVELLFAAWDISHFKQAEEKLNHAALHDPLTGLANRAHLQHKLSEMVQASRNGSGFAVLHLDMDGFKKVNDALGHEAGDKLIVEVGERLKSLLRSTDLVARTGGDEFVLVLAGSRGVGESGQEERLKNG